MWYNLGITYRDCGDIENSRMALLQAYSLNDCDEELLETLALVSFSLRDYDNAFEYCYECLDLNPINARCWNNLGVFFFSRQEYNEASEAFETALSINSTYYDALFNLRDTYYELGDEKAAKKCDAILKTMNHSEGNF